MRLLQENDRTDVIRVAQALTQWFDSDPGSLAIPLDVQIQDGFVAEADGCVPGFITLNAAQGRVRIGWRTQKGI